jgi:hypothetical protein
MLRERNVKEKRVILLQGEMDSKENAKGWYKPDSVSTFGGSGGRWRPFI